MLDRRERSTGRKRECTVSRTGTAAFFDDGAAEAGVEDSQEPHSKVAFNHFSTLVQLGDCLRVHSSDMMAAIVFNHSSLLSATIQ